MSIPSKINPLGTIGLPAGYARVAYLESTGTQYLKLPSVDFASLELDMKFKCNQLVKYKCIFSNYIIGTTNKLYILQLDSTATSLQYCDYGTMFSITPDLTAPLNIKLTLEKLTINEKEINITRTSGTDYKSPFYLLSQAGATHFPYAFLWFVNLKSDTGELKLIPALDPTGAPCMFDKVSKTPYYNAGTGDFLYPGKETEVSTFSLRRPITYAQLTEHGVRRLYHAPKGYNGTKEEYAAEFGWKPLVETPAPEEGYWAPEWRETEDEIVLEWVETEPPADEFGLPEES